jgi:hypothetical protein
MFSMFNPLRLTIYLQIHVYVTSLSKNMPPSLWYLGLRLGTAEPYAILAHKVGFAVTLAETSAL